MCAVQKFIDWGMARWKTFTVFDAAVFKACLLSIGALFGVRFAKPLKKALPFLWLAALVSYGYLIWRLVFDHDEHKSV